MSKFCYNIVFSINDMFLNILKLSIILCEHLKVFFAEKKT